MYSVYTVYREDGAAFGHSQGLRFNRETANCRTPEASWKLAGGVAQRNHRNLQTTIPPRMGRQIQGWLSRSNAPAGAIRHGGFSGGSRSLRSLHHRLISEVRSEERRV